MGNLNAKLIEKGKMLGDAKARRTQQEVKAALIADLPEHLAVEDEGDAIIVRGRDLGRDILDNSSLRDIAFLMRGVR